LTFVGDAVEEDGVARVELHHRCGIDEIVNAVVVERDSVVPRMVDVLVPTNLDCLAGFVVRHVGRPFAAGDAAGTGLEGVGTVA
jgi:hypothetical protein